MQSSIRTPGSIWAKLIDQCNSNAKKPEGRGDAFVYFVGARGSGKSTLLNRFLYPSRVEVPKPSEGLEYTYARKPSNFDHERKDLAHIWEFGGSHELAEGIAKGDQLFLTAKQVTTAVVVVVVDLSDPTALLGSLLGWLRLIKDKLSATFEKFEKKGLQLPEQLRQRAKSKLYGGNEDKDAVWHSGVSLVIAATKFDRLQDQDPELKKILGRTLRYIAHAHGAFLVYVGGLHEAQLDKPMADNLDRFTKLLNHLVFTGLEKKPAKQEVVSDHNGPLMVSAGMDKFRDIGRPRGGVDGSVDAGLQEWKDLCDKMFPPKATAKAAKFTIDERYKEEEVDLLSKRKMAELEAFRKDQEAAKKRAAAAGSKPRESGNGASKPPRSTKDKDAAKDGSKPPSSKDKEGASKSKDGKSSSSRDRARVSGTGETGAGGEAGEGGGGHAGELRGKQPKESSSGKEVVADGGEAPAKKKSPSKIKAVPAS